MLNTGMSEGFVMNDIEASKNLLDESVVTSFFEENEFFLIYQRKVSLKDRSKTVGLEAFLRLRLEDKTVLSPGEFLPVVERMGFLPELTELLITQVTSDWDLLTLMGLEHTVAVNIDTSVFSDSAVLSRIISFIENSNMPASRLSIDIVLGKENKLSQQVIAGLNRFRMIGVHLSLDVVSGDQLGMSEIEKLPIDEVKIGRTLICNIFETHSSKSIIKGYLDLSRRMAMTISAIGIENEEEANWLTEYGFDHAQGFLFGQPVEIAALPDQALTDPAESLAGGRVRIKVLVVEDDADYGLLLTDLLSEHYDVSLTNNEADALELFSHKEPEILLLDVNLAEGNGFSLAHSINSCSDSSNYSIIFLSGNSSQDNQIKAYEAGGVAFLAKPVPLVDIVTRISRVATYHENRMGTHQKIKDTEAMAFQSMREASHYGGIVQFMKEISMGTNEPGIAKALFKYMKERGLSCSMVFRDGNSSCSFDISQDACSPAELNVFELLHSKGRLYEFGHRLMVNDNHVSFLIKNMPDNEVEKGQARDYVAALVECMEARYMAILQNRVLGAVVNDLRSLTDEAITSIEHSNRNKQSMVDKFSEDISLSFHLLDLNGEQEQHLNNIVQDAVSNNEEGEISTDDIVKRITAATDLLSLTMSASEGAQEPDMEEPEDEDELF